jgi:hypothetical protein
MSRPESASFKLARAYAHLDSIEREIRRFGEQEPYGLRHEVNPDRTQVTTYLTVLREPPPVLALLIGDCVQNLRGALDHTVFQLPRAAGTPARWQQTSQFPIADDATRFQNARPQYAGITAGALAVLEQSQPYFGGKSPHGHPLVHLRELSNADKHRLITPTALVRTNTLLEIPPPITGWAHAVLTTGGLEDGAVLGKLFLSDPAPQGMPMNVTLTFGVTLRELQPAFGVLAALERIYKEVVAVIARLTPFL